MVITMEPDQKIMISRARQLRRQLTDTERFVWARLRGRRFAGYKFRRQKPIAGYIVDFVCNEHLVIVELDGSQHLENIAYDEERTYELEQLGYRLLRFWNHIVLTDWEMVEEVIWQALQSSPSRYAHQTPLTPSPSPLRGEGNQTAEGNR